MLIPALCVCMCVYAIMLDNLYKSCAAIRLVKIDEKYGKPQKNCNKIILEIFQS